MIIVNPASYNAVNISACSCEITDLEIDSILTNPTSLFPSATQEITECLRAITGLTVPISSYNPDPSDPSADVLIMSHILFETSLTIAWSNLTKILKNTPYKATCIYKKASACWAGTGLEDVFDFPEFFNPNSERATILEKINNKVHNKNKNINQVLSVLQDLDNLFYEHLKECAQLVFEKLGGKSPFPQFDMASIGEGGGTLGLSGIQNEGIRFFRYNYFIQKRNANDRARIKTTNIYELLIPCLYDGDMLLYIPYLGVNYTRHTIMDLSMGIEHLYLIVAKQSSQKWEVIQSVNITTTEIYDYPGITSQQPPFPRAKRKDYIKFDQKIMKFVGARDKGKGASPSISVTTFPNDFPWRDLSKNLIAIYDVDSLFLLIKSKFIDKFCNSKIKILGRYFGEGTTLTDETTVKIIFAKDIAIKLPPSSQIQPKIYLFAHLKFEDNQFAPKSDWCELPPQSDLDLLANVIKQSINKFDIDITLISRGLADVINPLPSKTSRNKISNDQNDRTAAAEGMTPLNDDFADRRYTFANIFLWPKPRVGQLEIVIEGYVSPLPCTWQTLGFPGKQSGFNSIIYPMRLEEGGEVIYNHVLSGLRTFGALEVILHDITIAAQNKLSTAEYQIFDSKLNAALNNLYVTIFDKNDADRGKITYNDYINRIKP